MKGDKVYGKIIDREKLTSCSSEWLCCKRYFQLYFGCCFSFLIDTYSSSQISRFPFFHHWSYVVVCKEKDNLLFGWSRNEIARWSLFNFPFIPFASLPPAPWWLTFSVCRSHLWWVSLDKAVHHCSTQGGWHWAGQAGKGKRQEVWEKSDEKYSFPLILLEKENLLKSL